MRDVVFVLVVLGFFALCTLYIRWCDSIVEAGTDEPQSDQRVES